jgi:hypothetical protein
MNWLIKNVKLRFILPLLVISFINLQLHGQNGLTQTQVENIQNDVEDIILNYYTNLNTIAIYANKNSDDAKLFINSTLQFFENNNVEIFNDLIKGGSEYIEVSRYLNTIITTFSKYPGTIEINGDIDISSVYWSEIDNHFVVKANFVSEIHGDDIDGNYINENNMLVVYFKLPLIHNTYGNPSIYWIMNESKSSNKGLVLVDIVNDEQVSENVGEKLKLEKQLQESKATTDSLSDEIEQIRKEYDEKFNEIENREKQIQRLEREIESKNKLVNDQLLSIRKKENEIDSQKKKLEKQEEQIAQKNTQLKQFEKKLDRTEKDIGKEKENLYSYRRVLSLGIGANQGVGTFNDICNASLNDITVFNPQLRGMVGYRFDFRQGKLKSKINRGHIIAGFLTYTYNKPQTILNTIDAQELGIPVERQEPVFNRTLELEAGIVLNEFLRLSGGIGGINGYRYNVATTAFHIPITRFGYVEFGSSFLFSRDFKQPQMHPYASVSFQFNDNRAKRVAKSSSFYRLVTELGGGLTYDFISGYDDINYEIYLNYKTHLHFGYKFKDNTSLGFWGNAGNYNQEFTQQFMGLFPDTYASDTTYTNYNPYFHVDFGTCVKGKYRISLGYGFLYPGEQKEMPIYRLTLGTNFNIYRDIVRINLEISDKVFNNDFQKQMFSVSMGINLKFGLVKL